MEVADFDKPTRIPSEFRPFPNGPKIKPVGILRGSSLFNDPSPEAFDREIDEDYLRRFDDFIVSAVLKVPEGDSRIFVVADCDQDQDRFINHAKEWIERSRITWFFDFHTTYKKFRVYGVRSDI